MWSELCRCICSDRRVEYIKAVEDQRATRELGERLRSIGDQAPFLSGYFDVGEICRYANNEYAAAFGSTPAEMRGKHIRAFLIPEDYESVHPYIVRALAGEHVRYPRAIAAPDGSLRHFEVSLVPHRTENEVRGFYAMWLEVTARHTAESEAVSARERLTLALEGSGLALWDLDVLSGRVYLSEAWNRILGKRDGPTETTLADLFDLVHPSERDSLSTAWFDVLKGNAPAYQVEHRVRVAGGEWRWIDSRGRVVERASDGRATRMAGTNADITQRKQAEERIRHLATHDALTDLPNRFLFDDRLRQAIANAERDKHGLIVMFVDLDRFKTVNESLGHLAGDELLRESARRLSHPCGAHPGHVGAAGRRRVYSLDPVGPRRHEPSSGRAARS